MRQPAPSQCWPSRLYQALPKPHATCGGPTSDSQCEDLLMRAQTPPSADLDPLGVATISHNLCCKSPLGCVTVKCYTKQLPPSHLCTCAGAGLW